MKSIATFIVVILFVAGLSFAGPVTGGESGGGFPVITEPPVTQNFCQSIDVLGIHAYASVYNDLTNDLTNAYLSVNIEQGIGGRYYRFEEATMYPGIWEDSEFYIRGEFRFRVLDKMPDMMRELEMTGGFNLFGLDVTENMNIRNEEYWSYDEETETFSHYLTDNLQGSISFNLAPAIIHELELRPSTYCWDGNLWLNVPIYASGEFIGGDFEKMLFTSMLSQSEPLTLSVQPVPEPATLAFLAVGGISLVAGAVRRRRVA